MQRRHENTAGNSYQTALSINTFKITNDISKATAESLRNSAVWRWHRKNPLNINDTAFRELGTLFEGKWATLGDTGQNKYLYDRRNTQEMRFDYGNKTLAVANIVPKAGSSTEATTNIGEYTVWITNIPGSTEIGFNTLNEAKNHAMAAIL